MYMYIRAVAFVALGRMLCPLVWDITKCNECPP